MMIPVTDPSFAADIKAFEQQCVLLRSYFRHFEVLFISSSQADTNRLSGAAPVFFGDLHRLLTEHLILQVCRMTDPASTRGDDNHTIAFLLQHYDFSGDPQAARQLPMLSASIGAFRLKVLPARNKLISHSDRQTILSGTPLGATSAADWNDFWRDLRATVLILTRLAGHELDLDDVGLLSDADGLLRALVDAACFDKLVEDPALLLSASTWQWQRVASANAQIEGVVTSNLTCHLLFYTGQRV